MKKLFLIVALAVSAIAAQAQKAEKGDFNIGLTVGFGMADIRVEDRADDQQGILNFSLGGVVDYTFADNFFLESGITLQRKGCEFETEDGLFSYTRIVNLWYVQVPVLLNYKFNLGSVSLIPQVGPYIGYGIGGKTRNETTISILGEEEVVEEDEEEEKVDSFGDKEGQFSNRFDFGFRFAGCLGIKERMKITLGYDLGCLDLVDDEKSKNGVIFGAFTFYLK